MLPKLISKVTSKSDYMDRAQECIILTKGQLGHSYTFSTMPIMIFSTVSNFGDRTLCMYEDLRKKGTP